MPAVGRPAVADGAPDCRKVGFIGAVAKHPVFQLVEIEAGQMAAVIMDVILAPHLAVGRDVHAGVDLKADHLLGGANEQRLVGLGDGVAGIAARHRRRIHRAVVTRRVEPVADRKIVGFRKGPYDGCQQFCFHDGPPQSFGTCTLSLRIQIKYINHWFFVF